MSGFKPTRQANDVKPPTENEVWAIATTGASVEYEIPAAWFGVYITMQADLDDAYINFGDVGVTCDLAAVCAEAGSPIALTPDDESCIRIPDGSFMSIRVPDTVVNFAIIGAVGGGHLRAWKSSN